VPLGTIRMASAAATSSVLTIPPYEMLFFQFNLPGYGGSDIISLRFNGDTGTTYTTNYVVQSTTLTTTPASPAITTGQTMLRLGGNAVANLGRSGQGSIYNVSGQQHLVTCTSITAGSLTASTPAPTISAGGGVWASAATTQITSIQLATPGGQTMLAGTSFAVWGLTPS
jgi:hypothetical protein